MLDLIPNSRKILLYVSGALDEWGQSTIGIPTEVQCSIRDLTLLECDTMPKGNKELKLGVVIRVAGNTVINVGDIVELDSVKYTVSKIKTLKDLTGEPIGLLLYI